MTDPRVITRAWEDAVRRALELAGPVAAAPEEVARRAVAPLVAPMSVLLEVLDQSARAMRTQAQAFDAAAKSFAQASELFDVQASLLEHAAHVMRDPAAMARTAGAAALGQRPDP